jgi:hypothetical protein
VIEKQKQNQNIEDISPMQKNVPNNVLNTADVVHPVNGLRISHTHVEMVMEMGKKGFITLCTKDNKRERERERNRSQRTE